MSRTIKFRIENESEFTVVQLRRLYNISNFYASNIRWTLDAFRLGPGRVEPVLDEYLDDYTCWRILERGIHQSVLFGEHYIDALIKAESCGRLKSCEPLKTNTYKSEVRVLGNESNAREVIRALSEISLVFPRASIYVSDQGHYLYTDLVIRRGTAIPDIRWIRGFMKDFISFITAFNGDVHIRPEDRTLLRYYISDCLVRLKSTTLVLDKLKSTVSIDRVSPEKLMELPQSIWPDIDFYTRNINLEDFKDYTRSDSNAMGGYFGEYWKLTDIDVELESYRLLGSIQKALYEADPHFNLNVF